ncbi:MAG: hypothetical protein ACM3X0_16805 [Bacteroidota bacterium]
MKIFKYELLLVTTGYFAVLICLAFGMHDIPHGYDEFKLTLEELCTTGGLGDPRSFATAAIDVAKNGWISSANDWIFNLWPPGFVLTEALIVRIFGFDAPVVAVLQVLAAGLFSVVLVLLYGLLRESVSSRSALLLPLVIFLFPVSRVFLLAPTGVTLGESYAIGFFLVGFLMALRSAQLDSLRYAALAGVCLALSAYFRSQFETILLVLTVWGIVLAVATRLKFMAMNPRLTTSTAKTIAVVLLVAHAAMLPWRGYHWSHHKTLLWVQTAQLMAQNSVMTSAELESKGGGFVVAGAGNLTCRIDPATCGDTVNARQLLVQTLINHPLQWYSLKLEVIGQYWFAATGNWTAVATASTALDSLTNGMLLAVLVVVFALLFARKVRANVYWISLLWLNISMLSAYFVIFTVAQFEVRYFFFPKILGVVLFLVLSSIFLGSGDSSKNSSVVR